MDSGIDMTDTEVEVNQPNEVVATDLEATETKPQVEATGETELYVDVEGDQDNQPNMSQEQAYAAWKKEKDKRKKKQELIDKQNEEIQALKSQLTELSGVVSKVSKGPKPKLEDFDYDADAFEKALIEYHSGTQSKAPEVKVEESEKQKPNQQVNDAAEFHLYQNEQEIVKHFNDYDQAKEDVKETFSAYGVNGDQAINMMARVAEQGNVNVAKVIYAAKKIPGMLTKLAQSNSEIQLYNLMKEAESKIKTREAKKIDTQPEPEINSSGPIDNSNAAVDKLRKKWQENPTAGNYKLYMQAKAKLKGK